MKSKDLALGGVMTAASIIIMYLTRLIPMNTLAILTLASCIIPITIIRSNKKTALLVYICTSIFSFLFVPINYSLLYILLFGIYGLIKFYIEKINKIALEIILKLIYFNIILVISLFFISGFLTDFNIKMPMWLFYLLSQVAFLAYDYAVTVVITTYYKRFKV